MSIFGARRTRTPRTADTESESSSPHAIEFSDVHKASGATGCWPA